jgi:TBC1 domain family protein 5
LGGTDNPVPLKRKQITPNLTKRLVFSFSFFLCSRWIRLLFGREFPLAELLPLWDALFAADPELSLVDLICVAMLLRVRWQCTQISVLQSTLLHPLR